MTTSDKNNGHSPHSHVQLVFTRKAMLVLGIVLLVPWLLVCLIFFVNPSTRKVNETSTSLTSKKAKIIEGKPGAWGNLQYMNIATEMPNEFAFIISEDAAPQWWFFKDYTQEKILEFLKSAGLSQDALASLSKPGRWEKVEGGCRVKPDKNLVLGMNPEIRAKIYLHLTRFTENKAQRAAFSFYPDRLHARLNASGLSDKSIALFKSLLYKQGPFLLFADLGYVLPALADDDEKRRFIKMISRKSTLLVRLRITANSDIDQLVGYWGTGGRTKDLRPLMDSLAKIEGGTYLDILHLLPRFARERLYTYPIISANAQTAMQDCNWSTMNFLNFAPDDRFSNMEYLATKLAENYFQIGFPEHLGDLVFLVLPSGESIHSAVFIADNIVFTKNGESVSQPWLLMKLEDMIELYAAPFPQDESLKPLFYRKKDL